VRFFIFFFFFFFFFFFLSCIMATGQIFSRTTQALFYNYKPSPVQRMLDFDFLCGRETPSVAGVIQPGSEGFQKLFFGQEEIAVPVYSSIASACKVHATADVFINFASFRRCVISPLGTQETISEDKKEPQRLGLIDLMFLWIPIMTTSLPGW
jgi:hypothetical protein